MCVCGDGVGGGGRSEGGNSNKLHGASCNTNKFINFVESVRPEKAIPCYIDVAQVTDTSKRFLICTGKLKSNQSEGVEVEVISYLNSGHIKHSQNSSTINRV